MQFRILGPLEVLAKGRALDVGGPKQRGLLAVLLLNANRVVSSDRLIDALWGERPPATAHKALQVYVSQLRRMLGKDHLVTRAPGYLLRIAGDELDLGRFEALLEQARGLEPEAASAKLREALSLWRGPPLAEFAYQGFAQAEIARLEELRLACLEERIEADLARGGHAELVSELEGLVKEHPLRERLRAQLMLALYRSGRQAEALAAYQDARRVLVDELGIEPGKLLRELEQAILRQDSALDPGDGFEVRAEPERRPAAAPLPSARAPIAREVRKTVTVLFADVTPVDVRLDPELLRRVTARAFEAMRDVLERHGGSVERPVRGAVTAVFGIPVVHEDDPLRAVRAATEMRERLAALNEELSHELGIRLALRTSVSTGEVVTGGAPESDVVGDAVTVAACLQQSARPGEILVGPETYRFVRDAVVVEPADQGEESIFRLLGVLPGAPGDPSRFESPMVGRKRELHRLQDAFEQAAGDASCQLFTILGAAGVGKSRLVQEFVDGVGEQALVARGRCLPYGEGITYWPVVEAVREVAALEEADSPEQSRERLAALLKGGDAEVVAQRVAELLGLAEAAAGSEEGFWAVRTLFEALARRRPLVLVFDDIHWGEPTFLELIEYIADWTREVPLLLVCIARPELLDIRAGWGGGKLNATAVLLEPLSEDESRQLVDNLADATVNAATRRRVIEAAEGNPFFVEEMLALALEDGRANGQLEVPPTIQALLAARLDRLGDDERLVLERAAVEGKLFHQGSIIELSPHALRPAVATNVAMLVRKELIRPERALFPGEHAFRFRHLLIRDAAYEAIPKKARGQLHGRHAIWLERKAGERLVEYEEIVGYHLEQAFRYQAEFGPVDDAGRELARRAAGRLGAAGRRAFARGDAPAAVNLISRAAALLPADDPARVHLVPNVRVVQGLGGDVGWAHRLLSEALETGDERLKAHALVQRGFVRLFTEPDVTPQQVTAAAEQAIAVFERLRDQLGLARAWRLVAQAHYLARRAGACAEASELALVHARRAEDPFEVKEIVEWLAIALALGPTPAGEALGRCEQLRQDVAGDTFLEVTLYSFRAYLEAMRGRAREAEELFAKARRAADDAVPPYGVAYFSIAAGLVEQLAGNPDAAERELRAGCQALEQVHEQTNYSTVTALLARALCAQDRHAEAEKFTRASEAAAHANDVFANVTWRSVRAMVLAREGDVEAAAALGREAVAFAEQSDFLNAHADALLDFADVLELAGRPKDAASRREEALRLYEQKGNVVSAARARSLLAYA
jgi:DNA-binding SARP family transcriptional activator/tetratricopeptide (TPR) repeat protein